MRAIKFRAWNPNGVTTLDGVMLEWDYLKTVTFGELRDELQLMQYTGREDTNGQEVYEGDIIERIGGLNMPRKFEVVFDERRLAWRLHEIGNASIIDGSDSLDDGPAIKSVTVIGNIYENPELLSEAA